MTRRRTALVDLTLCAALCPAPSQENPPAPQPEHFPQHALQRLGSWTQRQRRPVDVLAQLAQADAHTAVSHEASAAEARLKLRLGRE